MPNVVGCSDNTAMICNFNEVTQRLQFMLSPTSYQSSLWQVLSYNDYSRSRHYLFPLAHHPLSRQVFAGEGIRSPNPLDRENDSLIQKSISSSAADPVVLQI